MVSIPRFLTLLCLLPLLAFAPAGDRPAYRLFTGLGQAADYDQMLTQLAQADVVLFGEQHNDPIAHWLELQVAQDLNRLKGPGKLVLGMEMFERDVQPQLTQYEAGTLPDSAFERQSRPWPNYATDYRPLLAYAQAAHLPVVATNVPRRYAQQVARGSLTALDALPAAEKSYVAPLPLKVDYTLPGYQKMADMFGGSGAHGGGGGGQNIIQAQALKDATMAYSIRQNLKPGQTLLHLNGSFHSDNHDGIVAYLRAGKPALRVQTLSVITQTQLQTLDKENTAVADYVIVVPGDMTKTY